MTDDKQFEADFQKELGKNELLRLRIIIGLFITGIAISFFNYVVRPEDLFQVVSSFDTYAMLMKHLIFFLGVEIFFYFIVLRYQQKGGAPSWLRYVMLLAEVAFPAIIMTAIIQVENQPDNAIAQTSFLIYFFFIIISVLHLDFKLSALTGIIAGLDYLGIYLFIYYGDNELLSSRMNPLTFYSARASMLIMSGIASGFVALQVRRTVISALRHLSERTKIERLFGQHVSVEVMNQLRSEGVDAPNSNLVDATVMFLDIRNFTPFAETLSPTEVIDFQNKFFGPVIECVNRYNGVVNQILGDGVMATFGAPVVDNDHRSNAIKAGMEIVEKIDELIARKVLPEIRIGIGLHSGNIVTGNIGNNIRKQFSVSGTTVILASRIEGLNKHYNTRFLVSCEALKGTEFYDKFENLGHANVKGSTKNLEVYKVA